MTETVADLSDAPFTGGVIVNKVILMAVLAFLLIVSTTVSAYVVGTLYFPGDTVYLNGETFKKTLKNGSVIKGEILLPDMTLVDSLIGARIIKFSDVQQITVKVRTY